MGYTMTITAYLVFLCINFVNYYGDGGVLELEQSGKLYVCQGGAMTVTCSTSADLLRWNITIPLSQTQRMFERLLSYIGTARMEGTITTTLTTLNVSRSLYNSSRLPLISTISTDNTMADLNGTVMTCSGWNRTDLLAKASVEIILVGNKYGNINNNRLTFIQFMNDTINIPNVNASKQLGTNDITVTLEWTHKNRESYSISVVPVVDINYTGRNSAELVVMYDNKYNVSVVASSCGTNRTTIIIINQVTCPHVQLDYVSHSNPALVGTVETISCPPGMVLAGPNVTTCMENRQWHPDPKIAMCKVVCNIPMVSSSVYLNFSSTLEESLLIFWCKDGLLPDHVFTARCYKNGTWMPNPSSHVCGNSTAAKCGDPLPPSDGYLHQYTSTTEGAKVNIVHVCQNGQLNVEEIICNPDGQWESINGSYCSATPAIGSNKNVLIILLGCSFGAIVLLVLVTIIAIAIATKKGLPQRSRNTSALRVDGDQRNDSHDYQDLEEYSNLQCSAKPIDKQQNDLKSVYSLLQPYDPENDEDDIKQTNSTAQDIKQHQPTTPVYADVISVKQKTHVPSFDPHDKIEYAQLQLKGHSDEFATHNETVTTSLSHPADLKINLDSLLIQLKPAVSDKWYQFGKVIGTEEELLDKCIQLQPEQCLVEILDDWLNNHKQPTWNEIAEALTEIGLEQLALDIKCVYETVAGKLPIEVDMDSQLLSLKHLSDKSEVVIPPPIPPRNI